MNIRRYDPSQPRDWKGRWVTKSSRGSVLYKKNSNRGVGVRGLKRNFVPYARISSSGTTVGANAGTILPRSEKRIVTGAYFRIEHVDQYKRQRVATTALIAKPKVKRLLKFFGVDKKLTKALNDKAPNTINALAGNKVDVGGAQVRVTSSRKYNPTITVRRGSHKVGYAKIQKGTREFNKHVEVLNKQKASRVKKRPARRKANRKR